jgi:hypothetical protein
MDHDVLELFIKLRLQGLSKNQIVTQLAEHNLSEYESQKYHHNAGEKIRDIQENEVLNTRVLHAQRFEMLYEWFLEHDFDNEAMKMMENIEELLGLGSNTIGLSIHNLVEKKPQKVNIYNWENLTENEHNRLKMLVDKCKK